MLKLKLYDKINKLCKSKKITKKQMCENIGLSYNTFNSMVARKSKAITLTTLQDISQYFDVTLDYLMDDTITDPNHGRNATVLEDYLSDHALTEVEVKFLQLFYDLQPPTRNDFAKGMLPLIEAVCEKEKKEER